MSCCNKNPSSFRAVDKTWDGRGTMSQIGSWDPYPELLNRNTGSTSGVQPQIGGPPQSIQGYIPMQYSGIVKFTPAKEKYSIYQTDQNPTNYMGLNQTWGAQKEFTL